MKKVLIALVCATAIIPLASALAIVLTGGEDEALGGYRKRSDKNDTSEDHQLIRVHWTANATFGFARSNSGSPILTRTINRLRPKAGDVLPKRRWIIQYASTSLPINDWHELTLLTEEANKLKSEDYYNSSRLDRI